MLVLLRGCKAIDIGTVLRDEGEQLKVGLDQAGLVLGPQWASESLADL